MAKPAHWRICQRKLCGNSSIPICLAGIISFVRYYRRCSKKTGDESFRSALFWDWLHSNTGELTRPVSSHLRDTPTRSGWNYRQYINIENSRHDVIYKQTLQRLQNPKPKNPFTLEPESCLIPALHALRSKRAKARYRVTLPTHVFSILKRLLPTRWLDLLLCRSA